MAHVYIRHQVNEMDKSMIQRCIFCGEVICDYSNASYIMEDGPPRGWDAGGVYKLGGMTIAEGYEGNIEWKNCQDKE